MEKVVNSRTLSRKDKQYAIRDFLKGKSGEGKPTCETELGILEELKAIKKSYSQKDVREKEKNSVSE